MKFKSALILFGCTIILLSGCSASGSERIRTGTAGIGGTYYSFGTAFAGVFNEETDKIELDVKATAGSAANLRLLPKKYIQLAIAQSDLIYTAYNDDTTDGKDTFSAVAGLYPEVCHIVVQKDSDIQTISDLKGRKVGIGEEESGTEINAEHILLSDGLTLDMIDGKNLNYSEAAEALKNGEIDAMFCTSGFPVPVLSDLSGNCGVRLIGIDNNALETIMNNYDSYDICTIPAGTYYGQTEDIKTIGVKAVLIASDSLSDETVYKITEKLFENGTAIQYSVPTKMAISEEYATDRINIPFHKGAAEYYAEKGITVESEEKK